MDCKLKFLFLGLLFVLCINSVSAVDSLNNMTLDSNVVLDDSNYIVDNTILIDDDVSISSENGATISANNKNTIFNISSNGKLTLSNLNLTNAKGINGGAIYNEGTLILNNCTFVNNKATFGGAIYNNGTMILNNCTFESNTVSVSGGAIYNLQDNLIIQNSYFANNLGTIRNGELKGGAVFNSGFNLKVINSKFVHNGLYNKDWYENGIQYGGAIYDCGGNLTVRNSVFGKNFIYGYTKNQGTQLNWKYASAIYTISPESTLINNLFDSNEIYSMASSYLKLKISNEGLSSVYTLKVTAINNTFLNNSAYNPVLYIVGNNSYIANNYFLNNSASKHSLGISIYVRGHSTVFFNNTFINNTGGNKMLDGANIFISKGGHEVIEYNYFENGNGIAYEGFLEAFPENYVTEESNVTIRNNIFNNSFIGIYLHNASMVNIDSNIFSNNSMGIHTYIGNDLNITNNYFKGGNSVNFGTGIDLNTNRTLIKGNIFDGLKSNMGDIKGSCGGIIFIKSHYDDEVVIEGNFFINNEIFNRSGLISASMPTVKVSNNYFGNNTLNRGSVFDLDNSKFEIIGNIIENTMGLLFKTDSDFYYFNDVIFGENQITDYTGNIQDYTQFKNNASTLKDYANEKYGDDSNPIFDMIQEIIKNIFDSFNKKYQPPVEDKPSNSTDVPDNSTVVDNSTSNGTDISDNSTSEDNNKNHNEDNIESNFTDSSINSDVDDILDKLTPSKETPGCDSGNPIESKSTKSNVGAGQSIPISNSHSSSPKAHEIEKSNVSKNIENNNYLILIIVVIIAIFALLAIGYKKK